MMGYELSLIDRLRGIHSALNDALGDTDVTHIEDDEEMRDRYTHKQAAEFVGREHHATSTRTYRLGLKSGRATSYAEER